MAARSSSSRLVSQLLRSSKTSPARPLSFTTRISCISSRARPTSRNLSTTRRILRDNTAPTTPSQSQPNASVKTTATPTGATHATTPGPSHRKYTFAEITSLTSSPSPNRLLIDVREPSELQQTGTIPTSLNLPLKTSPDFMFLSADEFEDRFGRPRPGADDEVIFYCRSGVRSKAAAELAKQAGFGGTVSEFPGSWLEWEKQGGKAER